MAKKAAAKGNGKAGLGLAALAAAGAAAAAGYYFYASENAPKHRKIAAKWADGMKKDVIKEAKKLQNITKSDVAKLVDQAAKTYAASSGKIDKAALAKAAGELKKHWDELRTEAGGAAKTAKKAVKKAAKTAKKAAKKMA